MANTKTVRELIIAGRLEDATKKMLQFLDDATQLKEHPDYLEVHDRALHLLSQMNEVTRNENLGISDDRGRNRLRLAIIDLDRDVEAIKRGDRINEDRPPSKNTGTGDGRVFPWKWMLGGLALVAIIVFLMRPGPKPRPSGGGDSIVEEVNNNNGTENNGTTGEDDGMTTNPTVEGPTEVLSLLPETRNIGEAGALTGSLTRLAGKPGAPPQFGDTRDGKEVQAFLTFSLNEIPRDAEILSADFYMIRGSSDFRQLGKVIVEVVNIDEQLDRADFQAAGQEVAKFWADSLYANNPVIDVLPAIKRLRRLDNRSKFTLRFRPDEVVLNNRRDLYDFRYGQGNSTRLIVRYR